MLRPQGSSISILQVLRSRSLANVLNIECTYTEKKIQSVESSPLLEIIWTIIDTIVDGSEYQRSAFGNIASFGPLPSPFPVPPPPGYKSYYP